MGAWLYAYDALGHLMSQSDAIVPAQTTCYGYDGHDRLISKVYQVGNAVCSGSTAQVSYSYDQGANGLGRRTGMSDATGDTAWSYDARGRLESETKWLEGQVFTSGYGYRSDDQLASVTDPDGEVVTTGYNSRGLAISLSGSIPEGGVLASSTYISPTTGYTPLGQISQLSYGNGLNANYTYHPQSARLTALAAPGLLDQHYEYEAVGNLKTITDTVSGLPQVTQFQYDDLDRLSAASGAYSAGYLYAPNGNLLAKREGSQRLDLAYPPAGQAHPHAPAAVTGQLSFSPEYDQNGNLQSGGGRTLTYDEEHRLTQVVSGTQVTRFAYDGDGRLVKRSAPDGRETLYVNPSFEVTILTVEPPAPPPIPHPERKLYLPYVVIAAPVISCGTPINGKLIEITKYYWFNAQRIAQRQPCGGQLLYLYHDQLGSTLATDQGEGARYWPFGGLRSGSLNATPYRFTGQRHDSYINLYLMGSRWYDPSLGRWIQPDTIVPDPGDPQSLNRYAYGSGNPVKFTDPTGHFSEDEIQKYLGVDRWDDVLAQFGEGGKYAGQWGWLEVLRDAHIGNEVAFSWSGGTDINDPANAYKGTFAEDKNGNLRLRNGAGVMEDPADVLRQQAHNWYNLYQSDSGSGLAPYNLLRQYKSDTQYTHLRQVDWDKLLNVLEADHVSHLWVAPALTGLSSILFSSLAVSLCTTGIGCVAGAELGVGAVSAAVATPFLVYSALDYSRAWWRESTVWAP